MSSPTQRSFSCLTCRQRKVKCDRSEPCSNCVKAGISCSFVAPSNTRRRKKKPAKEGLHARLRRYEKILKSYGAKIDTLPLESVPEDSDAPSTEQVLRRSECRKKVPKEPHFVSGKGRSRYLDNELWSTLTEGFHNPNELFSEGSDDDLAESLADSSIDQYPFDENAMIFGMGGSSGLGMMHPPQPILHELWKTYLTNVDPISKLIHIPTFRKHFEQFSPDMTVLSKSTEALIFAVYYTAVASLEDVDIERLFGEPSGIVVKRYRYACQQALANASFLRTTSPAVLQAFTLYIIASNSHHDSGTMLCLTGIAVRIARRMGIHRDGSSLGLNPFDTEMRRRLWWQVASSDMRISEICGGKPSADLLGDSKPPLNINDTDIWPGMPHPPVERVGVTDMFFYSIKCLIGSTLRMFTAAPETTHPQGWCGLTDSALCMSDKDKLIDKLEDEIEQKFLRYCDPLEPQHVFASLLARTAICKIRLAVHHPRHYSERGLEIPQHERDLLLKLGSRVIESGNVVHSSKLIRRFRWLFQANFLWDSYIYTLMEMRHRKTGPEVDRVWDQIAELLSYYPQVITDPVNPLYVAVCAWTLNAWEECMAVRTVSERARIGVPHFIRTLHKTREKQKTPNCQGFKGILGNPRPKTSDGLTPALSVNSSDLDSTMGLAESFQGTANAEAMQSVFGDPSGCTQAQLAQEAWNIFGPNPENADWAQFDMFFRDAIRGQKTSLNV